MVNLNTILHFGNNTRLLAPYRGHGVGSAMSSRPGFSRTEAENGGEMAAGHGQDDHRFQAKKEEVRCIDSIKSRKENHPA